MDELKIWLAIRTDLEMSPGKIAVQAAHAVMGLCYELRDDERVVRYMKSQTVKIAVRAKNEDHLWKIYQNAKTYGIGAVIVVDAGRTEIESGTPTVVAFGPCLREDLSPTLSGLQLYVEKKRYLLKAGNITQPVEVAKTLCGLGMRLKDAHGVLEYLVAREPVGVVLSGDRVIETLAEVGVIVI